MLTKILRRRTGLVAGPIRSFGMTNQSIADLEQKYVTHNYASFPVAIEKAERIYVTDCEGRQYMDFMAGYSSTNQGHCHPKVVKAAMDQIPRLTQTSRAFMNTHLGPFSEYICNTLGFDKFLAMNSGVEACESAIKVARRWGYVVKGVEHDKASVIMMNGNFWGRSITASGACDDETRYKNFGPFTPGFPLVDYNDVNAIEAYF